MRTTNLGVVVVFSIVCLACSPLVSTHTKPQGLNITSDCVKEGENTRIRLGVQHLDDASPWSVEFIDESPTDIQIQNDSALTVISWKMDKNRMKKFGIKPYKLKLSNSKFAYSSTVAFRTTSEQILGAFIQSLIQIH